LALALVGLVSCAGRTRPTTQRPQGDVAGLYKVRLEAVGQKTRRFRLLLFAELPDRFHGEVLTPLGATVMILDGGENRLAVTLVRERVAFVGDSGPDNLRRLFGLELSLAELVRGLLTGEAGELEVEVRRESSLSEGLPQRLEIVSTVESGRRMTLELKRLRRLDVAPGSLGTGEPPPGLELRPLEELVLDQIPGSEEEP
jgi:hypothetical protein